MSADRTHRLPATACLLLALAGCGEASSGAPSRDDPDVQEKQREALQRKALERVPETAPAIRGEVPQTVMHDVRAHLAQRTGADPQSFEVTRGEFVEWPDGAMGCPQPGMTYTQQPVRGYAIVLVHDGRDFDYRVAESGYMTICESTMFERPPSR